MAGGPRSSSAERVAVAGLGAVGLAVVRHLDRGIAGLELAAVSARNLERANAIAGGLCKPVPVLDLEELPGVADIVVECLPSAAFPRLAGPTLRAGRTLVVVSVGALLDHPGIVDLATGGKGRIIVPTGALLGLDAVQAAAEGVIHSVRMKTRKPPAGLAGSPYFRERGLEASDIVEPTKIFEGTARAAIRAFPANVNVAVALSLAGIGPDRTFIEIWADPSVDRNMHTIVVDSDSARLEMSIGNIPTVENPATGRITALSVVAALRRLHSSFRIGT